MIDSLGVLVYAILRQYNRETRTYHWALQPLWSTWIHRCHCAR